ncbi:hypothetical protein B0H13DRAFT_1862954 [Mycena leptocephala]|nr:hypothetical protein B0H13DRAFT_1862954 [Mycena leptocephala]
MSQTLGTIRDGPASFSGEHDPESDFDVPDVILRSGDGGDLYVHKTILKFVSIFSRNMLNGAGNPTDPHSDGKPVVVLPGPAPYCTDFFVLLTRYVFKGVLELLEKLLNNPILIDAQPHRIYAIARLRSLPELARKAALATLTFPLCPPDLLFPELDIPKNLLFKIHPYTSIRRRSPANAVSFAVGTRTKVHHMPNSAQEHIAPALQGRHIHGDIPSAIPGKLGVKAEFNGQPHVPFADVTVPPTLLQVSKMVVFPKEQPENGFPPPAPGKVATHFGFSEDIGDEEGDLQRVNKANAGEGKEERCITVVPVHISDPLMDVPHILEISREICDRRMRMQFACRICITAIQVEENPAGIDALDEHDPLYFQALFF